MDPFRRKKRVWSAQVREVGVRVSHQQEEDAAGPETYEFLGTKGLITIFFPKDKPQKMSCSLFFFRGRELHGSEKTQHYTAAVSSSAITLKTSTATTEEEALRRPEEGGLLEPVLHFHRF
jgi:hypothetical protein